MRKIAWKYRELQPLVYKYGNDELYGKYLEACQYMVEEKVERVGASLLHLGGYYCGHNRLMVHLGAVLVFS